ncbi:MAG TPA: hypothetical protein VOA87_11635, partial [Thermoanaerobaculia bacterium]|nr:hypothetical protein [Thermoanaerobaculia bacterium]
TEQHFASPDTPAALIAFYRRRLGDKRMRRWGKDSVSWDVPVASSNPEIQQWKSVQIAPFNAITDGLLEGVDSRCRVQPRFWAFGEVTLIESGGPAHPRALIR